MVAPSESRPVRRRRLPLALAAFAVLEDLLDERRAALLEPWMTSLAAFVGAAPSAIRRGHGDPDGYADLARRGPYERLLASEWALTDEVPDEFFRRAAMSEHLFLALDRVDASPPRGTVVLFDAGPDQLGQPRLAQLALLALFSARARAAGSRMAWGTIQHPGKPLSEVEGGSSTADFLAARSLLPVDESLVARWQNELEKRTPSPEVWLVGGETTSRSGAKVWPGSRLVIREDIQPAGVELVVEKHGGARRAELRLPSVPATAARDLLQPPPPRAVVTAAPAGGFEVARERPIFSDRGRRLYARTVAGDVVTVSVAASEGRAPARLRLMKAPTIDGRPTRVIGVTPYQRGHVLLVQRNDLLYAVVRSRQGHDKSWWVVGAHNTSASRLSSVPLRQLWADTYYHAGGDAPPSSAIPPQPRPDAHFSLVVRDDEGKLVRLEAPPTGPTTGERARGSERVLFEEVLAFASFGPLSVAVRYEAAQGDALARFLGDKSVGLHGLSFPTVVRIASLRSGAAMARASLGFMGALGSRDYVAMGVDAGSRAWDIVVLRAQSENVDGRLVRKVRELRYTRRTPADVRLVVGLGRTGYIGGDPTIICLDRDGTTLTQFAEQPVRKPLRFSRAIEHITVSHDSAHVAIIDELGTLQLRELESVSPGLIVESSGRCYRGFA